MPPLEPVLTVAGIVIGCWLATAVILRAAIALTNGTIRTNDPADKIKTPSFAWSMIVSAVICVPWLAGLTPFLAEASDPASGDQFTSFMIGTPISLLITGGILCLMLAMPLRRGFAVAVTMTVMLGVIFAVALFATRGIAG